MKKNQHITEYLNYYCEEKNNTPFAVLIKGKWGSGKTYFMKEHIKNNSANFLHISLYGLSKVEEINEKILLKIIGLYLEGKKWHWFNNSKFSKIGNTSVNYILKKYKIDKNEIISVLNNTKNKIIIFDDLERSEISINKLLGFINHLVEFENQKVILLANEEELLKPEDKSKKYLEIKEKLIGKEFSIESSARDAIKLFIKNLKNKKIKEYSENMEENLLNIFYESTYENLRLIQYSLIDFEYFFKKYLKDLKTEDLSKNFENLFYEFIVISLEFKKGTIKGNLVDEFIKHWDKAIREEDSDNYLDKYNRSFHIRRYFPENIFDKILRGVRLDEEEEENLKNHINSLISSHKESWKKLWNRYEYSDIEFFENLKDVLAKWENKEYKDFFVILHVFAMFLDFTRDDVELLNKKQNIIFKEGYEYIEFLIEQNKFPLHLKDEFKWYREAYGFVYCNYQSSSWKDVIEFIKQKIKELEKESITEKIKNRLLPILKREIEYEGSLNLLINHNFYYDDKGQGLSYFQYIDMDEFYEILKNEDIYFFSTIGEIFEKRYKNVSTVKNLKNELPFLIGLKRLIKKEMEDILEKFKRNTPRLLALKNFMEKSLKPSIEILKDLKK